TTLVIGSTPSTAIFWSCSIQPRMPFSSIIIDSMPSSCTAIRASLAIRRTVALSTDIIFAGRDARVCYQSRRLAGKQRRGRSGNRYARKGKGTTYFGYRGAAKPVGGDENGPAAPWARSGNKDDR